MNNLGQRLILYRAVNGLSQREFAKRVGLGEMTIVHIERNPDHKLRASTRARIEYVLSGGKLPAGR